MRIALVHDWLTGMRGGEKALEVLCELYPQASLFALVHVPGSLTPAIERLRPRTSFIQRLPMVRRYYRQYLPLFPVAIEQFDLDGFDLIVSTSHCAAKSIVKPGRARHLCYCFTPMRYAWDQFDAYFGADRIGTLASHAARPVMAAMARWDAATSGRANRYLAISRHVARRIRRYYNREATVVYPPVDTAFFQPDHSSPGPFFLIVSALVPYKRVNLAIEAARRAGVPLRIVGEGPELARLRRQAGPSVEFLGYRTNEEIRALYREAAAVVLPGEEDFGIVPVEAQACGRPVVALARGGALETVVDGETGVLVREPTAEALADGMRRVTHARLDPATIRRHAEEFGRPRFAARMLASIEETMNAPADQRW
jgi:glycosyltransferase involved in cell wall biosynthesis